MRADYLVDPETLARHVDDPAWVIFDTRHDLMNPQRGPEAYAEGHIPGAFFIHVDHDLAGEHTGSNGRHPLPDPQVFAAKMNQCGVAPGRKCVIYDDAGGNWAVRLWWMLRWLGHEDVVLLDGQLPAWKALGLPMSKDVPAPRAGQFVPRPLLGATVDAAYIAARRVSEEVRLIDARNAERFEGKVEPVDPVAGHIPGAVNRFWQANLAPDGRFKPEGELRTEFNGALTGKAADRVVHYCGSGVTACHNIFAMELAGLTGSRLYPGSWSEWCADASRPVARGS